MLFIGYRLVHLSLSYQQGDSNSHEVHMIDRFKSWTALGVQVTFGFFAIIKV